jgi:formate dehydrogenase maturation protein FdhE
MKVNKMNDESVQYCPVCGRNIVADNVAEFQAGEHDGYLFVHDDIPHSDEDMEALSAGVQ